MTAQEKANELVEKFKEHSQLMIGYGGFSSRNGSAKQCALIAVDELIKATTPLTSTHYWEDVKQKIEKI